MKGLIDFALKEKYSKVKELGDKLSDVGSLIEWEVFRPIVAGMFDNKSEDGGRPNVDEVVMIKLLLLQEWYGLSDQELEKQATDRLSFQNFLGFPDSIPDYSTVWYFRERLARKGKDKEVWDELQRQLNAKGPEVQKGSIQDAAFMTSDPGHAESDKPRGDEAKTRRSKDGTWTKKYSKSFFGFKLHAKTDMDYALIRAIETTTASTHDS
ncbi:MAG: IS5 family transposase, partial [Atribacterota bacterium]